jgi:hypothetical protein
MAGVIYLRFGTLSPCDALRETVRHGDPVAAALPDSVVDIALTARYGALSSGRCIEILLNNLITPQKSPPTVATPRGPPALHPQGLPPPIASPPDLANEDSVKAAVRQAERAANECKAKRLRGELPSRVASARCSNPRIIEAFANAHYRYMDLIELYAEKSLQLALIQDRNKTADELADLENAQLFAELVEAGRRREAPASNASTLNSSPAGGEPVMPAREEPSTVATAEPQETRPSLEKPLQLHIVPELARLMLQARLLREHGDIGGARSVLELAAGTGYGPALFGLAETYDPNVLSAWGTYGTKGNVTKARDLYAQALAAGIKEAQARLDALRQ